MTYTTDKTAKSKSAFCINNLKANDVSKYAHISTVNLSHRLTGEVIVKSNVKVQPPLADMLQTPTAYGQHQHSLVMPFTPMTKVESIKHLQRFTPVMDISKRILISQRYETIDQSSYPQIEDMLKGVTRFDIGIYRNQTLAFLNNLEVERKFSFNTFDNRLKGVKTYYFGEYQVDKKLTFTNSLLRNFRSTSRARSCIETPLKTQKVIAKEGLNNYPSCALSKISRLALVGYDKSAHIVRFGLFLCVISLCFRIVMARLEGEAFALASYLIYWSTNPFQLCHPYLVVNGRASVNKSGVHTHV